MRLAVLALLALPLACVLVVDPAEYGSYCRFAGEDSQCGTCVAAACGPLIDACCGQSACQSTLRALDACATKHDDTCTQLSQQNTELARCIDASCAAVCAPLSGVSKTSCEEVRGGRACTCEGTTDAPNDFVCSKGAYPRSLCCAPPGWPDSALKCTCARLDCDPTQDGCFCNLVPSVKANDDCGSSALSCCADHDVCLCGPRACQPYERSVPHCNIDVVSCPDGTVEVTSCSARVTRD